LPSLQRVAKERTENQLNVFLVFLEKRSTPEKKLAPYNALVGVASSNVPAYSNGNDTYYSGEDSYLYGVYMGLKWQCVEYARRWTFLRKGATFQSVEGANNMWTELKNVERASDKQKFPLRHHANGSPTPPMNESYLIYPVQKDMPYGHVAVIVEVLPHAIRVAEQNFYFYYWPQNYAREIPLVQKNGRYFIQDTYEVYGWIEIDTLKQLKPLDQSSARTLETKSELISDAAFSSQLNIHICLIFLFFCFCWGYFILY
jgi:glutathionylspermidine amidase/synthetase